MEKIRFKDLSWPLKAVVIVSWFDIVVYGFAFLGGLLGITI
jgi:hypothetical protein